MHHLNGPGGGSKNKKSAPRRQNRSKTKESAIKPPPNVSLEPLTTSVKVSSMFIFVHKIQLEFFYFKLYLLFCQNISSVVFSYMFK